MSQTQTVPTSGGNASRDLTETPDYDRGSAMEQTTGRPGSAQQLTLITSVAGSARDLDPKHHPRAFWIIDRILHGWTLDQIVVAATDEPWTRD